MSITLPERGLFKGNQLALQDFENTLAGLTETKAILDDIMAEAKTPEGATDKSITSKSARTLKDINSLIPVYQEVVRLFKEGGAKSTISSGAGRSGNIQDLNLQKGSFTTDEGENE